MTLYHSKNNVAVILALGETDALLTNVQLARKALGGRVTMSKRVMVSHVLKRLVEAGYVIAYRENLRVHYYELTPLGETLYEEWRPPLRTCRLCGVEAKTEKQLTKFVKDRRARHGYQNLCKNCINEPQSTKLATKLVLEPHPKKPDPIPPMSKEIIRLVAKLRPYNYSRRGRRGLNELNN